jgi:hypothetical protein
MAVARAKKAIVRVQVIIFYALHPLSKPPNLDKLIQS